MAVAARKLLNELKRVGLTHMIGLPDNSSAPLFDLLQNERRVRGIAVTREGEAFAIAAGLWMGGKAPAVLIQNTGLLESGDSLRGTAMRMRVPLLCLITCRGYEKMRKQGLQPRDGRSNVELLSRADIDSAALLTEPTLEAWGVEYYCLDESLHTLHQAAERARIESKPVALLISEALV